MQLDSPRANRLPFNPKVLEWARNFAGYSLKFAAQELKVTTEQLREWENPQSMHLPSKDKAQKMATLYDQPFLEFFLKKVPEIESGSLVPDFRCIRGAPVENELPLLLKIQRWGEEQRMNLLDLVEVLEIEIPQLPTEIFDASLEDVEIVSRRARDLLGPSTDIQIGLNAKERNNFPTLLRDQFSQHGILVLYRSELMETKTRGVCLYESPLPVMIYTKEAPSAQAFTIAHELGHVILKQRGISGSFALSQPETWEYRELEQWCDRFAAAFLIPEESLAAIKEKPARPQESIDDALLDSLAKKFAVSTHAMMIRLVELGYVDRSFYWSKKRTELIQADNAYTSPPVRPKTYSSRFQKRVGNFYTRLVIEAWATDLISSDDSVAYFGVKKFKHFDEIRRNFSV